VIDSSPGSAEITGLVNEGPENIRPTKPVSNRLICLYLYLLVISVITRFTMKKNITWLNSDIRELILLILAEMFTRMVKYCGIRCFRQRSCPSHL